MISLLTEQCNRQLRHLADLGSIWLIAGTSMSGYRRINSGHYPVNRWAESARSGEQVRASGCSYSPVPCLIGNYGAIADGAHCYGINLCGSVSALYEGAGLYGEFNC